MKAASVGIPVVQEGLTGEPSVKPATAQVVVLCGGHDTPPHTTTAVGALKI